MFKNVDEIVNHYMTSLEERGNNVKRVNIPYYYKILEFLEKICFYTGYKEEDVTFITCNLDHYNKVKKTYSNCVYIYDNLEFNTINYYLKDRIYATRGVLFLDTVNSLPSDVVETIINDNYNILTFVMYDMFIPRMMLDEKSTDYYYKNFNRKFIQKMKSSSNFIHTNITLFLNKIRTIKMPLDGILETDNEHINCVKTYSIKPNMFDITKPIITSLVTVMIQLNISLRNHYDITDSEDPLKPVTGDYLVTHGPAVCFNSETGKTYTLPRGYRFKVLTVIESMGDMSYEVRFKHQTKDGEVEVALHISKAYFESLYYGDTEVQYNNTYKVYFGYVLLDSLVFNNHYESGYVIYDDNRIHNRKSLYTSILPIKRNLTIYYSLTKPIEIES